MEKLKRRPPVKKNRPYQPAETLQGLGPEPVTPAPYPTEPGFYWACWSDYAPQVVEIIQTERGLAVRMTGVDFDFTFEGYTVWGPRLTPPALNP